MRVVRFLLRRSPGAFLVASLAGVFSGLTSAVLLAVVHLALSDSEGPRRPLLVGAFVAFCLINPLTRVISEYLLLGLGQRSVLELRLQLTRRILSTPLVRLEALGSHRLLATLIDDVNALSLAMVQLPILSVTGAVLTGCMAYLAWLSGQLFLVLLAVMAIGVVSYYLPLVAGERRFQMAREEQDGLFGHFRALTEGIQELKLHRRRSGAFVGQVLKSCRSLYRHYVTSFTIFNVSANWGHLLFFVVLGFLIFGAPSWIEVAPAVLGGYALTLLYLMSPLQGLLDSLPPFSRAGVALRKIESLGLELEQEAAVGDELTAGKEGRSWRSLELDAVSFAYHQEDGAHDFVVGPFDLTFRPGELVFLVGGNGSGKTTFAKLLTGLYVPDAGEIRFDGEPIDDAHRDDYRQLFSMVFATPHLFDHLLGIEGSDLDRRATGHLEALELGGKVRIEEGRLSTTSLSQGQRKRLALLVAYLEDRPIYLFDEWAADQDPVFREIFYVRILPELKARGKTVLVISHDDRYYRLADRILKLELGRVVHDGDFESMLEEESANALAWNSFATSEALADAEPATLVETGAVREEASRGREPAVLPTGRKGARWKHPVALAAVALVLVVAAAVTTGILWLRQEVEASLPHLEGELAVAGIGAPVVVEEDALGVPTIRASSREDIAFATGFLHGQERFFQMDLLRRRAAGELAELFGSVAVDADLAMRRHRFRERAIGFLAAEPAEVRDLLGRYAEGVEAGRRELGSVPPEYLALGVEPRPWRPEDSFLVLLTMFVELQEANGPVEEMASLMRDALPPELYAFLTPPGTEWDTPILGEPLTTPPIPGPDVIDLRDTQIAAAAVTRESDIEAAPGPLAGSNAWALAPTRTTGGGLLANDLHLALALPNIWYRAAFVWPEESGEHGLVGVTLPGTPLMVLGSNGRVAWGLTNGVFDTRDLVVLEVDGDSYRTPEGMERFVHRSETVRVRGGIPRALDVVETRWGPVVDEDSQGRPRALRWTAHEPEAVNFELRRLETVTGVEQALSVARRSGTPGMNLLAVDAEGRIGWTVLGRLPRRVGFDGHVARSWADGERSWQGWVPPEEVPRVVDPPSGLLWNANQRMVGGKDLALLGDGGYPLGARGRQIRDALTALERATPADMLRLQLDDRALFLQRWRDLLLDVLTPEALAADPRRAELRTLIEAWGGHAAVDAADYRVVRTFRLRLARSVFASLTARCRELNPDFDYTEVFRRFEGPLWRLVTERPAHLLVPPYESWEEYFLAVVDDVLDYFDRFGPNLSERTWGERNVVTLRHPLSLAVPGLGPWLDTPAVPLPGDDQMPRVQSPDFGATLRMVVSPGHEEEGFFHMPGGQSGHPLASHYQDGQDAWVQGEATPFLPGPVVRTLRLIPSGGASGKGGRLDADPSSRP